MNETFKKLSEIDISPYIEKKEGLSECLSYISWANAWKLVSQVVDVDYRVVEFDGRPYLFDEHLGYIVKTKVKIEGVEREMYLPVMDGKNKAQKHVKYSYTTKYGEKEVQPATMFDINTAIMRCLVKNLALFGFGISLYCGEDINTEETIQKAPQSLPYYSVEDQLQRINSSKKNPQGKIVNGACNLCKSHPTKSKAGNEYCSCWYK